MGEGFALRWCQKHDVILGSREAQKAKEVADNYAKVAREAYGNIAGSITGIDNNAFAKDIDVLILSIPYEFIDDTCGKLTGKLRDDCVVVSPIVPMTRTDAGFIYIPLEQGKKQTAEMVADRLPPRSRIVSAFHSISESKLKKMGEGLDADTFICGDDQDAITEADKSHTGDCRLEASITRSAIPCIPGRDPYSNVPECCQAKQIEEPRSKASLNANVISDAFL